MSHQERVLNGELLMFRTCVSPPIDIRVDYLCPFTWGGKRQKGMDGSERVPRAAYIEIYKDHED